MKAKDLKNSILQMAVEGKLVPQDPNDEPANVLLERIREEKHRLIAEGKAKFPKGGESIIYTASDGSPYEKRVDARGRVLSDESIADEVPFELPEGWCWARLDSLAASIVDGDHQAPPQQSAGIPFLVISNISSGMLDFHATRFVGEDYYRKLDFFRKPQIDDLLLTVTGSFGIAVKVNCGRPFCFQRHIALIRPIDCVDYIVMAVSSPGIYSYFKEVATGTAQKTVSLGNLRSALIPLPPLAEQRRIAGRVSELMPLIDAYGELEGAREELDAALPGRLRRSVLQEAVRGRLAPQDPSDEPAGELLARIRAERRRLAAEGKVKLPRGGDSVIFTGSDGRRYEKRVDARGRESEPACIEGEIPFEIPEGWAWARLETICLPLRGSGIKRSEVTGGEMPCVRYGELYTTYESLILDIASHTTSEVYEAAKKLDPGEVIMTLTGENDIDIGRAVFNATSEVIAFGGDLLALKGNFINGEYLAMLINSPAVAKQRTVASTGNIIVHLSAAKIERFVLPIPPVNEQARILALLSGLSRVLTNQ